MTSENFLQLVWKQVLYMPKGIVGVHMPYIQTALNKNTMHIGIKGYPSFWEGLLLSKFKKRNGFVREKNLWYQDLHFFLQQFQQRKAVLLFIGDVSLPITMLTHLWIIHNCGRQMKHTTSRNERLKKTVKNY